MQEEVDDILAASDGSCWTDAFSFKLDSHHPNHNHELKYEAKDTFTPEVVKEIDLIKGKTKTLLIYMLIYKTL